MSTGGNPASILTGFVYVIAGKREIDMTACKINSKDSDGACKVGNDDFEFVDTICDIDNSFLSLFYGACDQNNSTSLVDHLPGKIQFRRGDSPWRRPWYYR
jgi:hypothetical protein